MEVRNPDARHCALAALWLWAQLLGVLYMHWVALHRARCKLFKGQPHAQSLHFLPQQADGICVFKGIDVPRRAGPMIDS
jgi:hypothetical protein